MTPPKDASPSARCSHEMAATPFPLPEPERPLAASSDWLITARFSPREIRQRPLSARSRANVNLRIPPFVLLQKHHLIDYKLTLSWSNKTQFNECCISAQVFVLFHRTHAHFGYVDSIPRRLSVNSPVFPSIPTWAIGWDYLSV